MIRADHDLLRVFFALPDSHPALQHFSETTTKVLTSRYTLAKSAEVSLEATMCEALVADALKGNTLTQRPTCPLLPTDLLHARPLPIDDISTIYYTGSKCVVWTHVR